MNSEPNPNIDAFNEDAKANAGYRYTTNAPLSARLANERFTKATLELCPMSGKRVLDIGCGDGTYTIDLFERGKPAEILGCDPAADGIAIAREKAADRPIRFEVANAYELPYPDGAFDVAHLRGVLHHMDQPQQALREALRVSREAIVVEPNGYNPVLKLLERFSPYHVQHDEKSYPARSLDSWVREAGGEVVGRRWVNLVPMFSPDWFARSLKLFEPFVERIPLLRAAACGVYVFVARKCGHRD